MQAVEARELAVLFLQKVLRGRAVQNRVTCLSVHTYIQCSISNNYSHLRIYIYVHMYVGSNVA